MSGAIISSSVATPGSGYTANQIVRVSQSPGPNDGAHVVILTVDGSGVPLTVSLPEQGYQTTGAKRGCGYDPASNVPTTFGGAGSGLALNILAVGPGSDATHGGIFGFTTLIGGSGYAVGDTGNLVQGANSSAVYRITGVAGGVVVNFSVDPGDGYADSGVAGSVVFQNGGPQPGSGSGASITITFADGDISQCPFAPASSGSINRVFGGPSNQ